MSPSNCRVATALQAAMRSHCARTYAAQAADQSSEVAASLRALANASFGKSPECCPTSLMAASGRELVVVGLAQFIPVTAVPRRNAIKLIFVLCCLRFIESIHLSN